jgi:aspartate/methionine/tyrosine aminotransferase
MNNLADELNQTISKTSIIDLFSDFGKRIYWPKKGILAQAADAKNKDINATIGIALEEDGSPMRLGFIDNMIDIPAQDVFPYAPGYGKPELRKKWRDFLIEKNPGLSGCSFSIPVVTNALTHGLSLAGDLFINPCDEIIIPAPYWGNYNLIFSERKGARIMKFPLFEKDMFNLEGLDKMLSMGSGKKVVILNFPNNPTGYSPTNDEVKNIIEVIKKNAENKKILVIIDDAYFGLVYEEGIAKESLFSSLCNLHENVLAVKIDGPTKEDYVWGFRIGFITFGMKGVLDDVYDALVQKVGGAIRSDISNCCHPSQSMLLKAFCDTDYKKVKAQKYDILKARYNKIKEILNQTDFESVGYKPFPFNSGYFMCLRLDKANAEDLRQKLLREYSTGIISIGDDIIRIAFSATPINRIQDLFSNINKAI